jgi:hypothetical protein
VFVGDFNNHILKNYILSNINSDSGFHNLAKDTALIANDIFLKIDNEKKIDISKYSIFSLKFTIKQSANYRHEKHSFGVSSEPKRLILYNKSSDSNFKVLFDSKYYQAECGTPDYLLDTIQLIRFDSTKFISADIKYYFSACCGSSEIDSVISYVYDKNFKLINQYEKFFFNRQNGDCIGSLPVIKRLSYLTKTNGYIDLVRKSYLNGDFKDSLLIKKILKIEL